MTAKWLKKIIPRIILSVVIAFVFVIPVMNPGKVAADPAYYTFVAIEDTQYCVGEYAELFTAQTQWIVDNAETENIVFVAHVGDIVNNGNDAGELASTRAAMDILLNADIPHSVVSGNHDALFTGDFTYYNANYPYTDFAAYDWYGADYPNNTSQNSYDLISFGGMDFIILNLSYFISPDVYTWANGILTTYSDRRAIVVTHGYQDLDGTKEDWYGQAIWDNITSKHGNVFAVISGHTHGVIYTTDTGLGGCTIHNLTAAHHGVVGPGMTGGGMMRLYRFTPSEHKISVLTYSPYTDTYLTDAANQFDIVYSMPNSPTWWDANWLNRNVLSFNASGLSENITNLPVRVELDATNFDFNDAQDNGEDIRFLDSNDSTTLPYHIEWWDKVGQSAVIWVGVPQINTTSDYSDYMLMYYNNAGEVDAQNASDVWDNAGAVGAWLFNEMVGATAGDSTSTNNDGTLNPGGSEPTWESYGLVFGAAANYVTLGSSYNLANGSVVASVRPTAIGSQQTIIAQDAPGQNDGDFTFDIDPATNKVRERLQHVVGVTKQILSNDAVAINTTYTAGTVFGAGGMKLYMNGTAQADVNAYTGGMTNNAQPCYLGGYINNYPFVGRINDIILFNSALSAETMEAWGMNYADTLLYFGGENPEPTVTTQAATGVTMNRNGVTGGTFNGNLTYLGGGFECDVYFEYGPTIAYGSSTAPVTVAAIGAYTATIPNNLTPGQTYHFRAVADNGMATVYGANESFTFTMPTVTTGTSTLSGATITLNGNLTNMGVASNAYVYYQYGTTISYGNTTAPQTLAGIGAFTASIVAPNSDITVYYRSVLRIGTTVTYGAGATIPVPSGTGGLILVTILRLVLAVTIVAGVLVVGLKSGGVGMLVSALVGLVAFMIVNSIITMLL